MQTKFRQKIRFIRRINEEISKKNMSHSHLLGSYTYIYYVNTTWCKAFVCSHFQSEFPDIFGNYSRSYELINLFRFSESSNQTSDRRRVRNFDKGRWNTSDKTIPMVISRSFREYVKLLSHFYNSSEISGVLASHKSCDGMEKIKTEIKRNVLITMQDFSSI